MTTGTAAGPMWTDVLTAVGTVGLAAFAAVTIIVMALLAKGQRADETTRAAETRAAADLRLREERELADARLREERTAAADRLRDERDYAEQIRLKERQTFAAAALLDRIAEFQTVVRNAVGIRHGVPGVGAAERADEALASLQRGAHTDALMLGDRTVADRYQVLVQLALAAAHMTSQRENVDPSPERISGDLRNYAIFVRLSLQGLIDGKPISDPGYPGYPKLDRRANDPAPWSPQNQPPGWDEAAQTDPDHIRFRPIEPPPHFGG